MGIGFIARQFTAGTSSSDLRPSSELEPQLSKLETQLVDAQQRLSRQSQQIHEYLTEARTDELTGLPNRRAIERIAKQELSGDSSTSTTTILAIVDIDHFKKVNDIYGHAAGDATLRFVANQLQQELSPHATVARFGGEEFLILMRSSMNDSTGQLEKAEGKNQRGTRPSTNTNRFRSRLAVASVRCRNQVVFRQQCNVRIRRCIERNRVEGIAFSFTTTITLPRCNRRHRLNRSDARDW